MTDEVWPIGKGATGRADWLRLVCVGEDGATGMPPEVAAELTGFVREPRQEMSAMLAMERQAATQLEARPAAPEVPAAPVEQQAPPLWRVVGPEVEAGADEDEPAVPEILRGRAKLPSGGFAARSMVPREPRPIIPRARLGRVLRQQLRQRAASSEVDLERLVDSVARVRPLRCLPRVHRPAWTARLQLYWDQACSLAFCWQDQWRVLEWLRRWRGPAGLELVVVDAAGRAFDVSHRRRREPVPADPATTVLALGDLGASEGNQARLALWRGVAEAAARGGARAMVLLPCPASIWPRGLAHHWRAIDWQSPRLASGAQAASLGLGPIAALAAGAEPSRLMGAEARAPGAAPRRSVGAEAGAAGGEPSRPVGAEAGMPRPGAPGEGEGSQRSLLIPTPRQRALVTRLLMFLSPAVRIEPALLRAVRLLFAAQVADLGTELLAWNDPRVAIRCRDGMALEQAQAKRARHQLQRESVELRDQVARLLDRHHWKLSLPLRAEELAAFGSPWAQKRAELMFRACARLLQARGIHQATDTERRYFERQEERQSPRNWKSEPLSATWALAHRKLDHSGFLRPLPAGLPLRRVAWALQAPPQKRWCRLWQRGAALECWLAAERAEPWPDPPGAPLAELPLRYGQIQIRWHSAEARSAEAHSAGVQSSEAQPAESGPASTAPDGARAITLDAEARPRFALPAFEEPGPVVHIESDLGQLELRPELGPPWATRLERTPEGLWVQGPSGPVPWPAWAETLSHDQYGYLATLQLAPGTAMRLRWIPPGSFMMGSPESELGRLEREGPQHRVELTRGYWLGEAPCTQAEWEAVMGENPSHFKGEVARPVEQVSWEDCQKYCAKLKERNPSLEARLPTEAEWEYACRAGTESAFSDGSECTEPEGKDPALEKLGWFDKNSGGKTHRVRQLEANRWGLYDVHGNVWEWCADYWAASYDGAESRDPRGPAGGSIRVIRGGSWDYSAQFCRSAYRFWWPPSGRGNNLGFRLAAGPVSPASQARSVGSGRERGAEGRGGQASDGDRSGAMPAPPSGGGSPLK